MKPICCGDRRDAELLLAAGMDGLTIDEVNPLWLKTPAAPFAAALVEDVKIDIELLLAAFDALRNALTMFSWKEWEAGSCRFARFGGGDEIAGPGGGAESPWLS